MPVWKRIEDEICLMDDMYTFMHSKGRFDEDRIPKLVSVMTDGKISAREIMAIQDPGTMNAVINEIEKVISEGITMKEKKYDDDSVHDATLEEIEKKEPRAD